MDPRDAWRRRYATQPEPWRGPVHAAPFLAGLAGRVVELGAAGGKVRAALPPGTLGVDWVREGLDAPAVQADVTALPLRDASVDALVAIHVLGHLSVADAERAEREWRRVLRPGGTLVLEVFAIGDAREGSGREVAPRTWERDGIATRYFAEGELEALFAGWRTAVVAEERRLRWGTRRVLRGTIARPYPSGAGGHRQPTLDPRGAGRQ